MLFVRSEGASVDAVGDGGKASWLTPATAGRVSRLRSREPWGEMLSGKGWFVRQLPQNRRAQLRDGLWQKVVFAFPKYRRAGTCCLLPASVFLAAL